MVMIDHIKSIAPPAVTTTPVEQLSTTQSISGIDHLQCSVCMQVLSQPVELHCRSHARTPCLIGWLTVSASCKCPCCFLEIPLTPADVKPAPDLILKLLGDLLVCCPVCKISVKAGMYDQHQCTPEVESSQSVSKDDLQVASSVIHHLLSTSPKNVVEIPTRGTVSLHVIQVNAPLNYNYTFAASYPCASDSFEGSNW